MSPELTAAFLTSCQPPLFEKLNACGFRSDFSPPRTSAIWPFSISFWI